VSEALAEPEREALRALANYFVGDATVGQALERICQAAMEAVPPAAFAGVSMAVDGRIGTYVFTHPEVVEVDQAQYDTGDGPCVEAFRTGEVVRIASTRRPGPHSRFRAVAARHGMLSVLSLPMNAGAQSVGALNFYARTEDAFDDDAVTVGRSFAVRAAYLLLNHQAYWDARTLTENLQQAMASRAVIEQAKGIIMATTGCTEDEAFEQLKRQSQHENVKLRDVARELVARARRQSPR